MYFSHTAQLTSSARPHRNPATAPGFLLVRQAWRVARKRNQLGCGGHAGDWEVKVLYTPGKGKC
ncbi:hypothetical protein FIV37_29240 [Pseudomonas gessardii]|nr:hypothetical protein [Pseudomonas gessardii]